jgi:hypothetical protein
MKVPIPATDFMAGETDVCVPVIDPTTKKVRWCFGTVTKVLDTETVKKGGNLVNMVVYLHRTAEFVSTHSNLVRKKGPPDLWGQDELEEVHE